VGGGLVKDLGYGSFLGCFRIIEFESLNEDGLNGCVAEDHPPDPNRSVSLKTADKS
jgi:hypothetical protein